MNSNRLNQHAYSYHWSWLGVPLPLVLPLVVNVPGHEDGHYDPQQGEHPRHHEHARVAQGPEQHRHLQKSL